ncbi:hypothetical protein [Hyphobacterium sp.]|jgi:hypothetical protein|uniref:hypothetical protein n=1 Tax=Hyphobacterium sp. TaxID=2004662 RepID=UPI003BAC4F0B
MIELLAAGWVVAQGVPRDWDDVLATEILPQWDVPVHRQYDFWIGEWEANWRPRDPDGLGHLAEGNRTHQFVMPILDGKAIMELAMPRELTPGTAQGRGFSLRYYDEANERWIMAQHWPNPQFDGVAFLDQLTGADDFGRIMVYSAEIRPRQPDQPQQHRRYTFSDIRDDAFRWDGANTSDGGQTWTTWNVVEFREIDPVVDLPAADRPLPGYHEGLLCTDGAHRAMDDLIGGWAGIAVSADGTEQPARLTAGRMLDGCAIAAVFERPEAGYRSATFWSWSPVVERWYGLYLNNRPGEGHRYYVSESAGEGAQFRLNPAAAIPDGTTPFIAGWRADTVGSPQRVTWVELNAERLVFRIEVRPDAETDWALAREYRLIPVD